MSDYYSFWKTSLVDIEQISHCVKNGTKKILGLSAGKREILLLEYGQKQDMKRRANYSSTCGTGSTVHYADKRNGIKPVILMVGGIHPGEMEGIAAIVNIINILETGKDLRGKSWDYIYKNQKKYRLLFIPCMNPDGRARTSMNSMLGESFETMRYYSQGTWKDGTLCSWPGCKAVHPILDHVSLLGTYFNDEGINLMHDNFFNPMAPETKLLLNLAEAEAVDFSVLLHGGGNCINEISRTCFLPESINEKIEQFEKELYNACKDNGLKFNGTKNRKNERDSDIFPIPCFNLSSAIHHVCGGISILYESNMGLKEEDPFTADEILDEHLILLEQMMGNFNKVEEGSSIIGGKYNEN